MAPVAEIPRDIADHVETILEYHGSFSYYERQYAGAEIAGLARVARMRGEPDLADRLFVLARGVERGLPLRAARKNTPESYR